MSHDGSRSRQLMVLDGVDIFAPYGVDGLRCAVRDLLMKDFDVLIYLTNIVFHGVTSPDLRVLEALQGDDFIRSFASREECYVNLADAVVTSNALLCTNSIDSIIKSVLSADEHFEVQALRSVARPYTFSGDDRVFALAERSDAIASYSQFPSRSYSNHVHS